MTDHQPLKWLTESDKLMGKLARWALLLEEYDFEVVHKAGVKNLDADGLSRNPSPLQEDLIGSGGTVPQTRKQCRVGMLQPIWHGWREDLVGLWEILRMVMQRMHLSLHRLKVPRMYGGTKESCIECGMETFHLVVLLRSEIG